MDTPRDNQDRFMKLMLSRPRTVRDLLALLPAEWTAVVDAASLRELPTEFIGERGCAFPVLTDPIARLGHDSPLADEPRVCIPVLKAFISALPSVRPLVGPTWRMTPAALSLVKWYLTPFGVRPTRSASIR